MKKILLATALAGGAMAVAVPAQAAVIVNGSFEFASAGSSNPASGGFTTLNAVNTAIDGWTVSSGSVDWINGYWDAQDGTHSIDLGGTGSGNVNGWIEQTFATTAGVLYTVTYYLSGNPDGGADPGKNAQVAALLNGTVIQLSDITGIQGTNRSTMNWEQKIFQFTATGPTSTLRFASTEGSQFGAAIDNVSISPVPEPATWALMIGGFGLIGLASRRSRRTRSLAA